MRLRTCYREPASGSATPPSTKRSQTCYRPVENHDSQEGQGGQICADQGRSASGAGSEFSGEPAQRGRVAVVDAELAGVEQLAPDRVGGHAVREQLSVERG